MDDTSGVDVLRGHDCAVRVGCLSGLAGLSGGGLVAGRGDVEGVLVEGGQVDVLNDVDLALGGPVLALSEEAGPYGTL